MAKGRPQRPYQRSWDNKPVAGLYRCPDGRWRCNVAGRDTKFTEPDERRALARFEKLTGAVKEQVVVPGKSLLPTTPKIPHGKGDKLAAFLPPKLLTHEEVAELLSKVSIDSNEFWNHVRTELIERPEWVAKRVGIPELANLRHMDLPRPALKITDIIDQYRRQNPSTDKGKNEALAPFNKLVRFCNAVTLDDLTQPKLSDFRKDIEASGLGAGTRKGYYGRIKAIISFGRKVGLDAKQIDAALSRCAVLWTAEPMPDVNPKPISREHFHTLLDAGNGHWRPWLLVGLNLCMSIEEVCGLKWDDFDMMNGTYAAIRGKTRRKRIPRAAVLWPETIAELSRMSRRGPYVFTSTHGTRYNKNTRVNDFADFRRDKAKLPDEITFGTLRDGAYTTACQGTSDERWARVLAGHKAAGLQDNYVLRNSEGTRLPCEAVYAKYGPFPT